MFSTFFSLSLVDDSMLCPILFPGHFSIKLSTLRECPPKWLERQLDERRVENISREVKADPAVIHNGQPWLAIADVTRDDLTGNKNLIRGAKLELIGNLHRHAAVKKVYKRKLSFSLETMFKSFYKTLK